MKEILETIHGGICFAMGAAVVIGVTFAWEAGVPIPGWVPEMIKVFVVSSVSGLFWILHEIHEENEKSRRLGTLRMVNGRWIPVKEVEKNDKRGSRKGSSSQSSSGVQGSNGGKRRAV